MWVSCGWAAFSRRTSRAPLPGVGFRLHSTPEQKSPYT